MTEPYTDEELAEVVRGYKPGAMLGAVTAEALVASVQRLQRERDEARRVAWVMTFMERYSDELVGASARKARAYPEVPQ